MMAAAEATFDPSTDPVLAATAIIRDMETFPLQVQITGAPSYLSNPFVLLLSTLPNLKSNSKSLIGMTTQVFES